MASDRHRLPVNWHSPDAEVVTTGSTASDRHPLPVNWCSSRRRTSRAHSMAIHRRGVAVNWHSSAAWTRVTPISAGSLSDHCRGRRRAQSPWRLGQTVAVAAALNGRAGVAHETPDGHRGEVILGELAAQLLKQRQRVLRPGDGQLDDLAGVQLAE